MHLKLPVSSSASHYSPLALVLRLVFMKHLNMFIDLLHTLFSSKQYIELFHMFINIIEMGANVFPYNLFPSLNIMCYEIQPH